MATHNPHRWARTSRAYFGRTTLHEDTEDTPQDWNRGASDNLDDKAGAKEIKRPFGGDKISEEASRMLYARYFMGFGKFATQQGARRHMNNLKKSVIKLVWNELTKYKKGQLTAAEQKASGFSTDEAQKATGTAATKEPS